MHHCLYSENSSSNCMLQCKCNHGGWWIIMRPSKINNMLLVRTFWKVGEGCPCYLLFSNCLLFFSRWPPCLTVRIRWPPYRIWRWFYFYCFTACPPIMCPFRYIFFFFPRVLAFAPNKIILCVCGILFSWCKDHGQNVSKKIRIFSRSLR